MPSSWDYSNIPPCYEPRRQLRTFERPMSPFRSDFLRAVLVALAFAIGIFVLAVLV